MMIRATKTRAHSSMARCRCGQPSGPSQSTSSRYNAGGDVDGVEVSGRNGLGSHLSFPDAVLFQRALEAGIQGVEGVPCDQAIVLLQPEG